MVNAQHSSAIIKDGLPVTMGDPAGFVIKGPERTVYHAGDTEIFSDMALIQRLHRALGRPDPDRRPLHHGPGDARRSRATSSSSSR